jgi:hypothetical protein
MAVLGGIGEGTVAVDVERYGHRGVASQHPSEKTQLGFGEGEKGRRGEGEKGRRGEEEKGWGGRGEKKRVRWGVEGRREGGEEARMRTHFVSLINSYV